MSLYEEQIMFRQLRQHAERIALESRAKATPPQTILAEYKSLRQRNRSILIGW